MHKKLLLVMLVPILAFSLVVIGCGSDDDIFDGDPTFRGIQGSWENVWTPSGEIQWFLVTANQIMMMNPDTYEGGLAYRTGFTVVHQNAVDGVPISEIAYIHQREFLEAMNYQVGAWLDADAYGWWGDGVAPGGVTWVGNLEIDGNTIPGLMGAREFFEGTVASMIYWPTINALNDLMLGNHHRQLEEFFRAQLGIGNNFAWRFRNNSMMEALVDGGDLGITAGFTLGDLGTLPGDAIFEWPAVDTPERVVTFRWDLVDWNTNEDRGTLYVMWLDNNSNEGDDLLIIFSSEGPYFWQDNLPLPVGVFARR